MSELLVLRERIEGTGAVIARLERSLAAAPDDSATQMNLSSLVRLKEKLEKQFAEVASLHGADVCRYRFIPDRECVKVAGLASVLLHYQTLVSVLFEAVTAGPRLTSKISADAQVRSSFDFGYTFSGSVGFAFTVANTRLIGLDTPLDQTFKAIGSLSRMTTPAEIKEYARQYGLAPIRSLYRWVEDHLKFGFAAEFEWAHAERTHDRFLVQRHQFESLKSAIESTSEEQSSEFEASGTLLAGDVGKKTFRFDMDGGATVSGTTDVFNRKKMTLRQRYKAKFSQTKTVFYSTEQEVSHFELLDIDPE